MSKKKAKNPKGNPGFGKSIVATKGNRAPWNSKERQDLVAALNDPGVLVDSKGKPVGISMRQMALETIGVAMQVRDSKGNPTQLALQAAETVLDKSDPKSNERAGGILGVQVIITQNAGPTKRLVETTVRPAPQTIPIPPSDQ